MLPLYDLRNYRIVITGSNGFLGRQLTQVLKSLGADLMGIDPVTETGIKNSFQEEGTYRHTTEPVNKIESDIIDFLQEAPENCRAIYHMAGNSDVNSSKEHPNLAFKTNVALTADILECARKSEGTILLFPSTGLVYGDKNNKIVSEKDPVYNFSVYGSTKLAAENLIKSYASNFSCIAVIARLSNVYGPNYRTDTVVGKILQQVREGKKIEVLTKHPTRDFIFSSDVVEALIRLLMIKPLYESIVVNVSTGIGITIGEMVSIASKQFYNSIESVDNGEKNSEKDSHLVLSNKKLRQLTGWSPTIDITQGFKKCADYFNESLEVVKK